jgi:hypothetical protein
MLEQRKVIRLIEETVALIEQREKETTRPEENEATQEQKEKAVQGQIEER